MNRSLLIAFVIGFPSLEIVFHQPCHASVKINSVNRGVTLDGVTTSDNSTGVFNTSQSNVNEFGTASANLESNIQGGDFSADGSAYEGATELDLSFDIRARVFFDVGFTLSDQYAFTLQAVLVGTSEDEHWSDELSLTGPGINLDFLGGPYPGHFYVVPNESGVLEPGDYTLSMTAYPIVYGGLDRGSATAYLNGQGKPLLSLSPIGNPSGAAGDNSANGSGRVPEPTSLVLTSLGLICAGIILFRKLTGQIASPRFIHF